jgi:uncharacterized protein YbcV (DUF1398 family)
VDELRVELPADESAGEIQPYSVLPSPYPVCSRASFEDNMPFPEAVRQLEAAGVERYHTDLVGQTKTYHGKAGQSHIEPFPDFASMPVALVFSAVQVKEAISAIQRQQIAYREFLSRIIAAGTATYDVFITGRKAIYFGRMGDFYIEPFPSGRARPGQ